MEPESNLKHLFGEPQKPNQIDIDSVVRRSRARRVPRIVGVAGISVLALGGFAYVGVSGLGPLAPQSASDSGFMSESGAPMSEYSAEESAGQALEEADKRAPAELLNLCGQPVADGITSELGLVFAVVFPDAAVGSSSVEGTVTLTNTSDLTVSGTTAIEPSITLAQNGIVVWHSNGPVEDLGRDVTLAPGESASYQAQFEPVVCAPEDDAATNFRTNLPPAPAGDYQVSAAMDFYSEQSADLVTGPAQTITLN